MRTVITTVLLLIGIVLQGQEPLLLQTCLSEVQANAPRLRDKQLIDEQGKLTIDNLKSNWLPSMNLNGKVSYKSDVVSLDLGPSVPFSIPEMAHEQYALNLDLQQTIYDGGLTKQQKLYERSKTATSLQQVEVDIYSLKEKVVGLYFTVLLLQENRGNLSIALENLKTREKKLSSAVNNGIAMESDLKMIQLEVLKVLQSISELEAGKHGVLQMLAVYMGRELSDEILLELPYIELAEEADFQRPELEWFDLQSSVLDAGKELKSVKRLPRVYAFGQAGMGMPGYNMLSDEFDTYYMVGAGVSWNIWDWSKTKREKQIMEIQKEVLGNTKETFQQNLSARSENELSQMKHYSKSIDLDNTMLEMRMELTENSAIQLENGTIFATDYMLMLNEESALRIQRSTHRLQLLKAIANYNLLKGTL